jgi:hypothetical protein
MQDFDGKFSGLTRPNVELNNFLTFTLPSRLDVEEN